MTCCVVVTPLLRVTDNIGVSSATALAQIEDGKRALVANFDMAREVLQPWAWTSAASRTVSPWPAVARCSASTSMGEPDGALSPPQTSSRGPSPVGPTPDSSCRWCLFPIRYAPVANQWWHVDTGAVACGVIGPCALTGDYQLSDVCVTCGHAVLTHRLTDKICSVCQVVSSVRERSVAAPR